MIHTASATNTLSTTHFNLDCPCPECIPRKVIHILIMYFCVKQ